MKINYIGLYIFLVGISGLYICMTQLGDSQNAKTKNLSNDLYFNVVNHSTCPQNGVIAFQYINGIEEANISYIVKNFENTAIGVIQDTTGTIPDTLKGLNPGIYTLLTIISFEDQIDSILFPFEIFNQYEEIQFSFNVTNETCNQTGSITINLTSGNAVKYAIIEGPVLFMPQESNLFPGLHAGKYIVSIKDTVCNIEKIIELDLLFINNEYNVFLGNPGFSGMHCDSIRIGHTIQAKAGSIINYPIKINYIVHPPDDSEDVILTSNIVTGGQNTLSNVSLNIPYYGSNVEYFYDLEIIDVCGDTIFINQNKIFFNFLASVSQPSSNCRFGLNIRLNGSHGPYEINFISAPPGFNPSDFNSSHPHFTNSEIFYSNDIMSMPEGFYSIEIASMCEDTVYYEANLVTPELSIINHATEIGTDCNDGYGNISLLFTDFLFSAEITSGPLGYQDVGYGIVSDFARVLSLNNLLEGDYTFSVMDSCGKTASYMTFINGYNDTLSYWAISPKCGNYDLFFTHESNQPSLNVSFGPFYYLQVFDHEQEAWLNINGSLHISGAFQGANGYLLNNDEFNYNIPGEGLFRIIRMMSIPANGGLSGQREICEQEILIFDHVLNGLTFDSLYSLVCVDSESGFSQYTLVSIASGVQPLEFKIIGIDNSTVINNGDDTIFADLPFGFYRVEVKDFCGNIVSRTIDLTNISNPVIQADNLCQSEPGKLLVDNLPFFEFEWRKSNEADILSNTNELVFDPFDINQHHGTYELLVTFNSESSCVNQLLVFEIPELSSDLPSAGEDTLLILCDTVKFIDLDEILSSGSSNNGNWYSESGFPIFNNNNINIEELPHGFISYYYVVQGLCNYRDTADITLNKIFCEEPCVIESCFEPGEIIISDPCNCFNENNFIGENGNIYFFDELRVTGLASPNTTISITSIFSIMYSIDPDGNPGLQLAEPVVIGVSDDNGIVDMVYPFYRVAGEEVNIIIEETTHFVSPPCADCSNIPIPLLSEWMFMIMLLLFLIFGTIILKSKVKVSVYQFKPGG